MENQLEMSLEQFLIEILVCSVGECYGLKLSSYDVGQGSAVAAGF